MQKFISNKAFLLVFTLSSIGCSNNNDKKLFESEKIQAKSFNSDKKNNEIQQPIFFTSYQYNYKYDFGEKSFILNFKIDNSDSLVKLDERLFSGGVIGFYEYHKDIRKKQKFDELAMDMVEDLNNISIDMDKKGNEIKFNKYNFQPLPNIQINSNLSFENKNAEKNIHKTNATYNQFLSDIENLKNHYVNKDYSNFLIKYDYLKTKMLFPEFRNIASINNLFNDIENSFFYEGFLKIENTPLPIFLFDKNIKNTRKEIRKLFYINLYHKIIDLNEKDRLKFIYMIFIINKFNDKLFNKYYNPSLIISNCNKIIQDSQILQSIKEISALNNKEDFLLSLFKTYNINITENINTELNLLIKNTIEGNLL